MRCLRIVALRNDRSGVLRSVHRIGHDVHGRPLVLHVAGYTPVDDAGEVVNASQNADGNWIDTYERDLTNDEIECDIAARRGWEIA